MSINGSAVIYSVTNVVPSHQENSNDGDTLVNTPTGEQATPSHITRRIPMKKRTLFSFIFNSERTYRLARTTVIAMIGIALVCGGMIGCENGEDVVTDVEPPVQVISDYDGDDIYFKRGGTIYEGHVIEGVSVDEVLVSLEGGGEMVINIDRIGGTLIADHADLGERVVLFFNRDRYVSLGIPGEDVIVGEIEGVYSDGIRKIRCFGIYSFLDKTFKNRVAILLDKTHESIETIRFAHQASGARDFNDGLYIPVEIYDAFDPEFKKFIERHLDE